MPVRRSPNLKSLRVFDAAARHLNFRRAAEELNVTQGAVAQQVRGLEEELGILLFRRLARGVALTETGDAYHRSIKRGLSIIDDATDALRQVSSQITVSVTPSFASRWLVPRLSLFMQRYPDIKVETIATEAVSDFRGDGVDLAIREGEPPFGAGVEFELLAELGLCAVCSPDYAAKLGVIEDFADFSNYQLIQEGHMRWRNRFDEIGVPIPRSLLQFNQTTLAIDAAVNGQGIALAPRLLLQSDLRAERLVCVWEDNRASASGYYLVYPKGLDNEVRGLFVEWLTGEIRADDA